MLNFQELFTRAPRLGRLLARTGGREIYRRVHHFGGKGELVFSSAHRKTEHTSGENELVLLKAIEEMNLGLVWFPLPKLPCARFPSQVSNELLTLPCISISDLLSAKHM